jgi:hypothetical protein
VQRCWPSSAEARAPRPNNAASFACGGYLETRESVCEGVLVNCRHEIEGRVDGLAGDTTLADCKGLGPGHDE